MARIKDFFRSFINASKSKPIRINDLNIAVVIHVFYTDILERIIDLLKDSGYHADLLITCPSSLQSEIEELAKCLKEDFRNISVFPMENKGRDILPFIKLGEQISNYDLVCKLHTKKSDYSKELNNWSDYLFSRLIGSREVLERNISYFLDNDKLGILSPGWFPQYPGKKYNWGSNRERVNELIRILNIGKPAPNKITFPAGSMLWFRPLSLQPIFSNQEIFDQFEEEKGQLDGTLAHAIERMFHLIAERQGYRIKILG